MKRKPVHKPSPEELEHRELLRKTLEFLLPEAKAEETAALLLDRFGGFAGVFLAGARLLFYLQISLPNHETYQTRVESAREQVQAGKTEVVLPVYPYPDFVHDTDPQKMDYIYRGITFREE